MILSDTSLPSFGGSVLQASTLIGNGTRNCTLYQFKKTLTLDTISREIVCFVSNCTACPAGTTVSFLATHPAEESKSDDNSSTTTIIVVVVVVGASLLLLLAIVCWIRRSKASRRLNLKNPRLTEKPRFRTDTYNSDTSCFLFSFSFDLAAEPRVQTNASADMTMFQVERVDLGPKELRQTKRKKQTTS
jgi:hypothetical protein